MRIISGTKKGFLIKGPPSVKIPGLKPMPDKVREAIFNILGNWVNGKKVLDLYAGTGAVGLEALSRGASSVTFVENSKRTVKLINDNLKKLDFRGSVFTEDATRFIKCTDEKYDLIFITPPHKEINFEVPGLAKERINKNGVIVLESDSKEDIPQFEDLDTLDQRIYGKLKITFLKRKKY